MTELERHIRSNAAGFDTEEPARGHEERFLARLDAAAPASRPGFRLPGWLQGSWRVPALALAAVAAVLLILRPGDPFREAGNDPTAIYLAYMDQVAGIYADLPGEDSAGRDAALMEMTEEEVPLFEQLPDEMPSRKRSRILKAYYGDLLAAARKLKNQ
ncbi:MAG: hypothetical protein K5910_03930 [Bacteroidales bacterium]|nr:hypothetical protein [Bacteroidales bacterium]